MSLRRLSCVLAVSLFLSVWGVPRADADTAYTLGVSSTQSGMTNDMSLGFEFTPNVVIHVTDLGFFDYGDNGLVAGHDVGIYRVDTDTTGTLVAFATVLPTDTSIGTGKNKYYYHPLDTPVTLLAGTAYRIAADSDAGDEGVFTTNYDNANWVTYSPFITVIDYNTTGNKSGRFNYVTSLSYPTSPDSTNIYSTPNFLFTAPEPASIALLALGGLVMASRRRGTRQ
jgi:hypothetical protein